MTKENFGIVSALMKISIPKKLIAVALIIGNSMLNAEDVSSEFFDKLDSPLTEIGFKQDSVISNDGVEINYFIRGSNKKALVFVHGFSCSSKYWLAQLQHFSKQHTVVAIDLAGHGDSGINREIYNMDAFGKDVVSVVNDLELEHVTLIGHSMGGPVIVEAANELDGIVDLLIGVDTLHDITGEPIGRMPGLIINTMFKLFYESMTEDIITDFFIETTDVSLKQWIREDALKANKEAAQGSLNALLTMDYPENLKGLSVPIKVINARSFRETMLDANLASYKNIEIDFFEGVGHFIMMERPSEFNEWLELKISQKN